ncbi:hypothetical protein QF91_000894, partial [Salmonella enterica subsp. salamae]|nr:hypothetical protein [Salmonella enterica subsp. salamae]
MVPRSFHQGKNAMAWQGLRFTLKVDGIREMSTAVVSFSLHQKYSIPFA